MEYQHVRTRWEGLLISTGQSGSQATFMASAAPPPRKVASPCYLWVGGRGPGSLRVPSDTTPEKSQRGGLPAWWGWKPSLPTWSPLDMGVLGRPQLLCRDDRTCRGEGRWEGSWGQEEVSAPHFTFVGWAEAGTQFDPRLTILPGRSFTSPWLERAGFS